jgi:phosphate/sulfate permease
MLPNKLNPKMVQNLIDRIKSVKEKVDNTDKVSIAQIEETSKRISGYSQVRLASIVGGVIGASGGIAIPASFFSVTTAGLVLSGPLGMILGAALFALIYRLRFNHKSEVDAENFDIQYNSLRRKLDDPNIPDKVKLQLEDSLNKLIENYQKKICSSSTNEDSKDNIIEEAEVIDE